jgi:hypothetical protein
MQKLFHFDAPRERYQCDAAVVWCFDNRFDRSFRKFLKWIGVQYTDPIKIAGGAKSLASPAQESDREFVLNQIRTSIRLHDTRRVVLMLHSDCGAYGGLDVGFGGDPIAERAHHKKEILLAKANLSAAIPDILVEGYFVDFEGVWTVPASVSV